LPEHASQEDISHATAPTGHVSVQEVGDLLRIFSSIDDPKLRRRVIDVVDAIAATLRKPLVPEP
jgi:hypothetical protein